MNTDFDFQSVFHVTNAKSLGKRPLDDLGPTVFPTCHSLAVCRNEDTQRGKVPMLAWHHWMKRRGQPVTHKYLNKYS